MPVSIYSWCRFQQLAHGMAHDVKVSLQDLRGVQDSQPVVDGVGVGLTLSTTSPQGLPPMQEAAAAATEAAT